MKGFLSKIWQEFVYGGHILSLGNVSVLMCVAIIAGMKMGWPFAIIIYLGTLAVYKLDRKRDIVIDAEANKNRAEFIKDKKFISIEILFSVTVAFVLTYIFGNFKSLLFLFLLLLLGLGYSYIFKNISKKIVGFKNYFVPIPYALLPLFFYVFNDLRISWVLILFSLFVYLRLWSAVLFYDLKDIDSDKRDGMNTLAVKFGKKRTYSIANSLNYFSLVAIIFSVSMNLLPVYFLILIILALYYQVYLTLSKRSKDLSTFSHIFCDGEYLFWFPLVILGRYLWR